MARKKPSHSLIGFTWPGFTIIDGELFEAALMRDPAKRKLLLEAVKIIDPEPLKGDDCRRAVVTVLMAWRGPLSPALKPKAGPARKAARDFLSALKRAHAHALKLGAIGPEPFADIFERHIQGSVGFAQMIAWAPPAKPKPNADLQNALARAAIELLQQWGRGPLTEDRTAKLAATLYGGSLEAMRKRVRALRPKG